MANQSRHYIHAGLERCDIDSQLWYGLHEVEKIHLGVSLKCLNGVMRRCSYSLRQVGGRLPRLEIVGLVAGLNIEDSVFSWDGLLG